MAEQLYQYYLEVTPGCQKMVLERGAYGWLAVVQVLGWVPG